MSNALGEGVLVYGDQKISERLERVPAAVAKRRAGVAGAI